MACALLSSVWLISIVVCSPPWFVPSWGIFNQQTITRSSSTFVCGYPVSIPYRIYSALGSFYIPLLVGHHFQPLYLLENFKLTYG